MSTLEGVEQRLAELAALEERNPHLSRSPLQQAEVAFYERRRAELLASTTPTV